MAKKSDESTKVTALRRQAEGALRATRRDVAAMPVKEVQQLVHELQVHQIELDMQNEELRRTQLELEAARDRYRDLYEFSPAGHLTLNIKGKVVEANLRAGTMLGIDRKKLMGQPLALFIASDDQDIFRRHCQDVIKTGTRQVCELHLRETSGASCCIYLESLAVQEESGPITHWRTAILDISERKRGEQKLASQQAQLEGIISSAMDAIITVDESGRVLVFNQAAESMFLCQAADVIGQPFDRFIPERLRQSHHGHMSLFALTKKTSRSMGEPGKLFGLRANGEEFPIEASISHVRVDDKTLMTVILRDITERTRAELASIEALATLDATRDGAFIFDPRTLRFSYVNEGAVQQTGYSREELLRMTPLDIKPEFDEPRFRATIAPLVSGAESAHSFTTVHRRKDGADVPVEINLQCVGAGTAQARMIAIVRDITERKIAEAALLSSQTFTRGILNSLSAHICVLDKDGVILQTNDAWKEFALGNSEHTFAGIEVGQNHLEVCRHAIASGQSTTQITLGGIEAVLAGSEPSFTQEYACHSPDEKRWFLMRVTPLKDTKGVVIAHTDISNRVWMALELEEHVLLLTEKQKELEALAGKLIEAQEVERRKIARELHDDFNQRLAALSVDLENIERNSVSLPGQVAPQLATIRGQLISLSDDMHDLAYKLHPSLLEHVGLEVAVRDHVAEFTKRTGLPATFTARTVPSNLSKEVATNLFRVMQESLQNVSKHAQATEVAIKLSGSSKGLGLVSMQERVRGLGGFLRIHSLPRTGTKVCAWIPRSQERA